VKIPNYVLTSTRAEKAESDRILDHSSALQFIPDDLVMLVQHLNSHVSNNLVATLLCRHHAVAITAPYNTRDLEQEETQPDPELNATWNKLVLSISNDTKGYKMTTVEALTHGKGTGRLVYGKHTAMAADLATLYRSYMNKALPKTC